LSEPPRQSPFYHATAAREERQLSHALKFSLPLATTGREGPLMMIDADNALAPGPGRARSQQGYEFEEAAACLRDGFYAIST
jgi:hypothetical protein